MPQLFGEKVRHLRRQRVLTQVGLAQKLGLASHAHIANLEAGRDVASLDLVVRVAHLFRVGIDYLLRDTVPGGGGAVSVVDDATGSDVASRLFGTKLRALRLGRTLSQTDLAHQLGLARRGYISNLETGRKAPSLELVVQIADLFEVTTDYLLRESLPVGEIGSGTEG
jgi:transcriptional regulator with XRE-family HTH domain